MIHRTRKCGVQFQSCQRLRHILLRPSTRQLQGTALLPAERKAGTLQSAPVDERCFDPRTDQAHHAVVVARNQRMKRRSVIARGALCRGCVRVNEMHLPTTRRKARAHRCPRKTRADDGDAPRSIQFVNEHTAATYGGCGSQTMKA